jgi:D-glycero-alpha-D-manno-heptose-7-phosphate kinase
MQNIITRTPLRITLAGGGSDMPFFYKRSPGAAVNATIDKYMYIVVHRAFGNTYRIRYSKEEDAKSIGDIEHGPVREALRLLDIKPGIEIVSLSDIPTKGSGLGSSSAYLVGLLHALHIWKGQLVSKEQLAREAVTIERDRLGEHSGLQDPYAVALGGLNLYEYMPDERVKVNPIIMNSEDLNALQSNLMLLYTDIRKKSNAVLESVWKMDNFETLAARRDMAFRYYDELTSGNWKRTGHIISEGSWMKHGAGQKSGGSEIETICRKIAALGGDVRSIGSGDSGFLLIFANEQKQKAIKEELKLPELKFGFEFNGSSVILFN